MTPFYLLGVFSELYGGEKLTPSLALLISLIGFFLVFIILGLLAVFVKCMGAVFDSAAARKTGKPAPAFSASEPVPVVPQAKPLPDNTSAGTLTLENVSEEEAVVIMAIVSHRSGVPLNRLQFHSIKLLEEQTK